MQKLQQLWEKKFFRVAAYMVFAVVSFLIFLLITFPSDRVGDIAANQIEEVLDHQYDVSVSDLRFWRMSGIQMRGVRLQERTAGQMDGDEERGLTIRLDQIAARFSPFRSLLNRGPTVRFQADVGGGERVTGTFAQVGTDQQVEVSMNRLDLRDSTLIDSLLGVRIFGNLDGDVDLQIDGTTGLATGGNIHLAGEQIMLDETTLQLDMVPFITELELPSTNFGNLDVNLDFEETDAGTVIHFEEFTIRGRDIQAQVWGDITLTPQGGQPNLQMRLQFNEEYVTEHGLDAYINMGDFREGRYEGEDGHWYGFEMSGTFGDVDFGGSVEAGQGPGAGGGDDE